MKNYYYPLLGAVALVIATVYSCSSLPGECSEDRRLKVTSGNEISHFRAKPDSVTIKLSDSNWTIESIIFTDPNNELKYLDSWVNGKNIRLFENDTCYVQRRDGNTLFIKMKENTTKLKRTIQVSLFSGNCGTAVKVVQAAE